MSLQTVEITLEVLLILIGLYLSFMKSYISEKGKNLATKQDIGEITSEVEKIKTEFLKETEQLKINLQYANQIKFSLRTEELRAVFDCYEKYHLWLNSLANFHFPASHESILILENNYSFFRLAEAKFDFNG